MNKYFQSIFSIVYLIVIPSIFSCNKRVYSSTAMREVGVEDAVIAAAEGAIISSKKKYIDIESVLPWEQVKMAVINYADGRQKIYTLKYDNNGKILGEKGTTYQDYRITSSEGPQWFMIKASARKKTAYLKFATTQDQKVSMASLPVFSQALSAEEENWDAVSRPGSQVLFYGKNVVHPTEGRMVESVALRF